MTLLFSDIAGSTRLLEELGDDYAGALAAHRTVLRAALARHGGVEVDTQGDALFAVFRSAAAAVAAAAEAQAGMPAPVQVRMGIHSGEPHLTDEGYVGIDVHRAARVCACAHGGQTVVSEQTRTLAGGDGFGDLGSHRLKDVGELHLYQAGDGAFPPLRTLDRGTLPPPPAALIGRDPALRTIRGMLADERARLVTVTGPGGIGKTSVALAAAAALEPLYADGAWFVDLAATTDPALLGAAIAAALDTAAEPASHLRDRHALLVLDNFEQIVAAATEVGRLLDACPGVAAIVTSREPLQVRGEREMPLEPLGEADAMEVFVRHARMVLPAFAADPGILEAICTRLDGMPLAIELAAARVRSLTPEDLLARLESRLGVLTRGARDAPARQRTLHATIAWSHDLLAPAEADVFAAVAVFTGGWTATAAAEVCDASLDDLESLVAKSLVRFADGRFSMLETIREFAAARLDESTDAITRRARHATYFAALAAAAEPRLTGPQQGEWLDRLAGDAENFWAAIDRCAELPEMLPTALRIASALTVFWFARGMYVTALPRLERLAAAAPERTSDRAGILWGIGLYRALLGDLDGASEGLAECLEIAREAGDEVRAGRTLNVQGLVAFFRNDLPGAVALFEEAATVARRAGDEWCLADALGTVGSIYPLRGDLDRAQAAGAEGLALARRTGDLQGQRMALFGLALADTRAGDLEDARRHAGEGLDICRALDDRWFVSYFLWILALVDLETGDAGRAAAHADESLAVARELGAPLLLVCALDARAACSLAAGELDAAEAALREADELGAGGAVPGSYVAAARTTRARAAAARGDPAQAARWADAAAETARAVGDPWAEARAMAARPDAADA